MSAPPSELLGFLVAVGAILVLATIAGQTMRWRLAPDRSNPIIEEINARIASWWAMVVLIGLALLAGRAGVVVLFAVCSFAALREFLSLTRTARADHWSLLLAFYAILPLQYLLVWHDWYGLYSIFIPVYAFLMLPVLSALRGGPERFLDRIAETQWAIMLAIYCASYVPALLNLHVPGYEGQNILLVAYLIFVVQFSDVMQFVWGKLVGRHRIAASISPSKTWEGFVGGVASASLAGMLLWWITPFTPIVSLLVSLLICLAGFAGGLVLSAIKRDRGVKDWGYVIPGHGGFIDRLDSVLFAAPIFLHILRYYWSVK
jgi:phosphatidate cytidylyltransferase